MRPGETLSWTVMLPQEPRIDVSEAEVEARSEPAPPAPPTDQITQMTESSIRIRMHAPMNLDRYA
jgi:hypothetical protein